ncbi:hypothetical protein P6144_00375 [Sphingomonas sp. HITSZ_GF]|uniref:hypothetical protein n=1 Tax=Sphingomonas sp. HITSZ_GF TaxID=3037247 RepID=UPI00240DC4DF|nr:hypothetical protein [Sphingomonas sp. HITSZ_GF]MDG2532091.1 hypothetical protein [Sphingomonas sp. HITSZ_GF]
MNRQSFWFLTDSAVRVEFHIREDRDGLTLDSLFNPRRDPDTTTFESAEEMADAMEERVTSHMKESGATLRLIRYRHDASPITNAHLARYAVPLLHQPDGSQ